MLIVMVANILGDVFVVVGFMINGEKFLGGTTRKCASSITKDIIQRSEALFSIG